MLFTRLDIHNLYSFDNAVLDLTFAKRPTHTTIAHEHLVGRENFHIKRVCVISGVNAGGKTSLGRLLNYIQLLLGNALEPAHINWLGQFVQDKSAPAHLCVEFATPATHRLHCLKLVFQPDANHADMTYASVAIGKRASVAATRRKLAKLHRSQVARRNERYFSTDIQPRAQVVDAVGNELGQHLKCGWYYLFSDNVETPKAHKKDLLNIDVMRAVLCTFDTSIIEVLESQDTHGQNGCSLIFQNGDTCLIGLDGSVTNRDRLSKGTYDAIAVAVFLSRIVTDECCSNTYFLDERMAFAHSELEQAVLNLLIEKTNVQSQLFYTTHNYDILDMGLPAHTYLFIKKENGKSSFEQPEHTFKKNDRRLLNYVKNNLFNTLPNTSAIDALL